jgi:hypothetical protein
MYFTGVLSSASRTVFLEKDIGREDEAAAHGKILLKTRSTQHTRLGCQRIRRPVRPLRPIEVQTCVVKYQFRAQQARKVDRTMMLSVVDLNSVV